MLTVRRIMSSANWFLFVYRDLRATNAPPSAVGTKSEPDIYSSPMSLLTLQIMLPSRSCLTRSIFMP